MVKVRRVLVVDDHLDSADMLCMMLRAFGHDCRAATRGALGLEIAREFRPEIALLDIGLPDISGYELARLIRAELGTAVYLTAITGWGEAADHERALQAGFDRHVTKPANGDIIRDVLASAETYLAGVG
jgi:DNA-binding response OmpR family regulator